LKQEIRSSLKQIIINGHDKLTNVNKLES